jgi:hypothetical protein
LVEAVYGISTDDFRGSTKSARVTAAKEILIVAGRRLGAAVRELSEITGINSSNVSRRYDRGGKPNGCRKVISQDPTNR